MEPCIRIALLCFYIFVFFLGIYFYISGCDSTIKSNCSRYYIKDTKVIKHDVYPHTCSRCIHTVTKCTSNDHDGSHSSSSSGEKCSSYCDAYQSYTCYDSFDIETFNLLGRNYSCKFYAGHDYQDYLTAINAAKGDFPLHSHQQRFIDKNTLTCSSGTTVVMYAYLGLVFLFIGACGFVYMMIVEFLYCIGTLQHKPEQYSPISDKDEESWVEMPPPSAPPAEIPIAEEVYDPPYAPYASNPYQR